MPRSTKERFRPRRKRRAKVGFCAPEWLKPMRSLTPPTQQAPLYPRAPTATAFLPLYLTTPRTAMSAATFPWLSILRRPPPHHQRSRESRFRNHKMHHLPSRLTPGCLGITSRGGCPRSRRRKMAFAKKRARLPPDRCRRSGSLSAGSASRSRVRTFCIKRKADGRNARPLGTTRPCRLRRQLLLRCRAQTEGRSDRSRSIWTPGPSH